MTPLSHDVTGACKASASLQHPPVSEQYPNGLAGIRKVPNEILLRVFIELYTVVCASNPESQVWIRVTGVCRHWHQVALAIPELWTCIVLTKPKLMNIFARRSGSLPLTLSSWDPSGHIPSSLHRVDLEHFIDTHRQRILHIRLARYLTSMWDNLKPFQTELPNLVSLELRNCFTYGWDRSRIDCYWTYNPVAIEKPKPLRSLLLFQFFIPWDSFIYTGLRRLDLRGQVKDHTWDRAPSMDTFLAVLARCPELEYLRLQHSGPTLNPTDPIPPPLSHKINLPHLKNIVLMNEPGDVSNLLQNLRLPDDARYTIYGIVQKDFNDIETIMPTMGITEHITSAYLCSAFNGPLVLISTLDPFPKIL